MGFVSEELNETEKQLIKDGKASKMAVVYGKEASIWKVRPAGPQTPSPTSAPRKLPTPSPGRWKRPPLVVKKEMPLEIPAWDSCLTPLPASLPSLPPLFATNSNGFIPRPCSGGSTNTLTHQRGLGYMWGFWGVGGRGEIRED